jgi:hypothetical protein
MNAPPPAQPCARPSCVMLLSLWAPPGAPWHARLMGADAHVHEFDSPFELARFVAQPACAGPAEETMPTRGLR